jgi:hypothetical protein
VLALIEVAVGCQPPVVAMAPAKSSGTIQTLRMRPLIISLG